MDEQQAAYSGAETTGFQSPAQVTSSMSSTSLACSIFRSRAFTPSVLRARPSPSAASRTATFSSPTRRRGRRTARSPWQSCRQLWPRGDRTARRRALDLPARQAILEGRRHAERSAGRKDGTAADVPDARPGKVGEADGRNGNLNGRFGRGMVRPAVSGVNRRWTAKAEHLSPRYTTQLEELPSVSA